MLTIFKYTIKFIDSARDCFLRGKKYTQQWIDKWSSTNSNYNVHIYKVMQKTERIQNVMYCPHHTHVCFIIFQDFFLSSTKHYSYLSQKINTTSWMDRFINNPQRMAKFTGCFQLNLRNSQAFSLWFLTN